MNHRRTTLLAAAALAALSLAGCEAGNSTANDARLTLKLTDAPGDFAEAHVQILQIYLQGSPSDPELPGGRFTLYDGGETFDLLTLVGTTVDLVRDLVVPAGTYSQMRLVLGDATIVTRDGTTYSTADGTLHCPSCASSGLKVKLPGGGLRLDNGGNVVVVDFDVSQSFGRQAGRSGRWVMHPVITATDLQVAGGVSGTVALEGVTLPVNCAGRSFGADSVLTKFVPQATAGEIVVSGHTRANGAFTISPVPPGTYTLGHVEEITFDGGDRLRYTAAPSVATANVGSGAVATANYTVTAVACVPAG